MTHKHEDCLALLEEIRWGGVPQCPYCESTNSTAITKERRYHCTEKEEPKIIPNSKLEIAFSEDIGKCLNWLRDSIDVLGSRSVDPKYMTTALTSGMLDKFDAYQYALTYIFRDYFKDQKELKELCISNNISESYVIRLLEEYVKNLIAKLKNDLKHKA